MLKHITVALLLAASTPTAAMTKDEAFEKLSRMHSWCTFAGSRVAWLQDQREGKESPSEEFEETARFYMFECLQDVGFGEADAFCWSLFPPESANDDAMYQRCLSNYE